MKEKVDEFFLTNDSSVKSNRILYTPSNFAKSSLVYIQEIGELQAIGAHSSSREELKSFLFFVVLDGEGYLTYNNKSYKLYKGDCVFIDCKKGYKHSTGDGGEKLWSLRWCHFYSNFMSEIYTKYKERGGQTVFHPRQLNLFLSILEEIYGIANSDEYIKDMKINERMASLLSLLMEESWHPEFICKNRKRVEIKQIKDYVDKNYKEKISLDLLSHKFYINKYYMAKLFTEAYGISINAYVNLLRVTKAKELLRFSDKRIDEIGIEVGMNDPNYFSRIFKKIEGISPSEFRKIW